MMRYFSYFLMVLGAVAVVFSVAVDALGFGEGGFQAAQFSLMAAGVGVMLLGWLARSWGGTWASFGRQARATLDKTPGVVWVLLGLMPLFLPYLVAPVFFGGDLRIHYPEGYLPKLIPIGNDLKLALEAGRTWAEQRTLTQFVFTPVSLLFYMPLTLLSYAQAYQAMTVITILSYLGLILLGIQFAKERQYGIILLITTVGLFSYGTQFELERGQSHSLTLMVCLLAVYLFQRHPGQRLAAYLLFSFAVQMKFYPALFVVLLVDDWQDWKGIFKRFAGLGAANALAFLLLGLPYFAGFVQHMLTSMANYEGGYGNHSIASYVHMLQLPSSGLLRGQALRWAQAGAGGIKAGLYLYFVVCFGVIWWQTYRRNNGGVNPDLLLACTVGAMILPSVSHAYTLPLLTLPLALALAGWGERNYRGGKGVNAGLLTGVSLLYAMTLFPPSFKPIALHNALPELVAILGICVIQSLLQSPDVMQKQAG